MDNAADFFTVFRSEEGSTADEARSVCGQLVESGLNATLYEDTQSGAWEVRVPAGQAEQAGEIISVNQPDWATASEEVDPTSDLDMVTVFSSETAAMSEMEAMSIKALLNSAGIPAVLVGNSTLPIFEFQVQVPREQAEEAERIVRDARAAGEQAVTEENA
jgi:hypothetical protein